MDLGAGDCYAYADGRDLRPGSARLTPDDKRVDEAAGAAPSDASSDSPAVSGRSAAPAVEAADDLESLSAKMPSVAPVAAAAAGDEEADLKALVALPGQRRSAVEQPVAPPAANKRVWLLPLLLGLGIGAGAAAVVFMAMPRAADPPAAQAAALADPPAAPALPPSAPAPAAVAAEVAPAPAAPSAQPSAPLVADAPARAAPAASHPRASTGPASAQPSAAQPAPAIQPVLQAPAAAALPEPLLPGEEEEAEEAAKASRSMDTLLDDALSPTARNQELERRQTAALEPQSLPLTASREEVTRAMTVLLPAIRGCAMGQTGLATAAMVVRNDGRVAGVEITGAPFAGTASGRCMEGVIRRARLAPFRQTTMRVRFPLAIQ